MKNFFKKIGFLIIILWFVYLILPAPSEIPALPQSLKSTEPGDTVQIPGISAYYTNLSRQEVINFYQSYYSYSSLFNIPLLTYRLNHPPEYFKELIRQTQQVTYFEEIVHPMRESLLIAGFEWNNDPFTKPEARAQNRLYINGVDYQFKVTIIEKKSNPLWRVALMVLIIAFFWWWRKEVILIAKETKSLRSGGK